MASTDSPLFSVATAAHCFDAQFHPTEPLLALSTIDGDVELHRYDSAACSVEQLHVIKNHTESCRTGRFLSATRLVSTSADSTVAVADVQSGERLWRAGLGSAGNALLALGPDRFAVGDDGGSIAVYDVRRRRPATSFSENADFISDMAVGVSNQHSLCATSGDGTLAVYDLRKSGPKGLIAMSDFQEDEYLSLAIVREGKKVVCGSQGGVLAIFTWGDFGDQKDRIKGHPMSVDAMVKLSEDAVLTGSSDGNVRVVTVHSQEFGNAIIGIVAEHGSYPIERLAVSRDEGLLASVSHGQPAVRCWPAARARGLLRGRGGEGGEEAAPVASADQGGDRGGLEVRSGADSSDDSDDSVPRRRKKRQKGAAKGKASTAAAQKASSFFSGL